MVTFFAFSNSLTTWWTTPLDTEVFRQSTLNQRQSLQEEYVGNCRKVCMVMAMWKHHWWENARKEARFTSCWCFKQMFPTPTSNLPNLRCAYNSQVLKYDRLGITARGKFFNVALWHINTPTCTVLQGQDKVGGLSVYRQKKTVSNRNK